MEPFSPQTVRPKSGGAYSMQVENALLIVEDEPLILLGMQSALESRGFMVLTSQDLPRNQRRLVSKDH
jgi:ActR/RegA family two-component response regulator